MFARLSALLLAIPFVSAAIVLSTPQGATTGGVLTITWTAATTDPSTFSLELVNPVFHNTYAISTNLQTADGTVTVTLPQVPVDGNYQIEAINISNLSDVYFTSGTFAIGAATSTSTTAASTTSTSTSSSTSTGTGTVTSSTSTPLASSVTTAATSASSSAAPTTFNSSGAASFKLMGVAPAAALVLSAVAGAAMVF